MSVLTLKMCAALSHLPYKFDDENESLCWAARCDVYFKVGILGYPPSNIDIHCDDIEEQYVSFAGLSTAKDGKVVVQWLKDQGVCLPEVTSKKRRNILHDIFFMYYRYFVGDKNKTPPLRFTFGKHGIGVCANKTLQKGLLLPIGYLNEEYTSAAKLDYFASVGCLTTCQLEGEDYSREICGPIRYINHSCTPNCHTEDFSVLEIQKKIEVGEELYLYYFDNSVSEAVTSFNCQCNTCIADNDNESDDDYDE